MTKDIRFVQRFDNFCKAFSQFEDGVKIAKDRDLSNLEKQGLIQSFEYTHELSWNVLKDFLHFQRKQEIYGPKDATRESFNLGLIENGEIWMQMIESRNKTAHTYNQETADDIIKKIKEEYFVEFCSLRDKFEKISKEQS